MLIFSTLKREAVYDVARFIAEDCDADSIVRNYPGVLQRKMKQCGQLKH